MLEHIFRNINDIRVFDAMVEFVLSEELEKKDIGELIEMENVDIAEFDWIMEMLDYPEYKRVEVEDTLEHFIRNKIIGIKYEKADGLTGCRVCKYAEKLKLPRLGEHRYHKPEEVCIGHIGHYYMKNNDITKGLRSAAFAHTICVLAEEENIDKEKEMNIKKDVREDISKV